MKLLSQAPFRLLRLMAILTAAMTSVGVATVLVLGRGTGEDLTGVVAPALFLVLISALVAGAATVVERRSSGRRLS